MVWLVWYSLGEGYPVFLVILLPQDFTVLVLQMVVATGLGYGYVGSIILGVVVDASVNRG